MDTAGASEGTDVERCELCVVGAGIGGLNALFSASRHLGRSDRVLVVDRRAAVGGMWATAYPYVRLHQPHPLFTAGNIAWQGSRPRHHLASRDEVLAHLEHCFAEIQKRVQLEFAAGYEYEGYTEDHTRGVVTARFRAAGQNDKTLRVEAKRLVDARGYGVSPMKPLELSSTQVRSVSPDALSSDLRELSANSAPIYVVGGGKTGMDTATALIERFPKRPLHLLIGAGTIFTEREKAYPTGLARHFAGTVGSDLFLELAKRFNGDNEDAVTSYFRERHGVALTPDCGHHMFGVLSRRENEAIQRGAKEVLRDHLVDVVDRSGEPTLVLRSGREQRVEPGSIFINTTGYFSDSPHEYQPFASPSERVLAINARSYVTFLPAYTGFLLVDVAYRGSLASLPLYELDTPEFMRRTKGAVLATVATHTMHNVTLLLGRMPRAALREFGANFSLWYPLHRQLYSVMRLIRFSKQNPGHYRKSLDRVRERFGVRLGPLAHGPRP